MRKLFLMLTIVCLGLPAAAQTVIPFQEIPYNVNYHWGIIDVMIARGVVTIESDGNSFYGTLDGTSIPWEGRIICVSDTLRASIQDAGGVLNETVEYQSGWYRHPPVSLFRSSCYNPADAAYFKNIAGQGSYNASSDSMEAITVTSDMIGMYYLAHLLNFETFADGEQIRVNIAGPYSRELAITYQGKGIYTVNGDTYPTYNCSFEYSYGAGMSGYPVDCKISVTDRIPVFISASLPVGRVEMLYDPQ